MKCASIAARPQFLPFARPDVGEAELEQIREVLMSGWVTTGPKATEFEERFKTAVGAKHAVAVNSCTAALHLSLEAVGVGPGDLVLTTPYTFAATGEVIRYLGATPVFVDVEPDSLNLDPARLATVARGLAAGDRSFLPPALAAGDAPVGRLRAIVPVHIAGLPADVETIGRIADEHGMAVVEDAAHAFPAKFGDRPIGGSSGRGSSCFSFYATKTITTGEGGMITTDDPELVERCRSMSLHGLSRDAWNRYRGNGSWCYEVLAPGYKYNLSDIAAAMGLAQLDKCDRMWHRRCEIARRYDEAFGSLEALEIPHDREDCQHAWHLYMLRLHLERSRIDRDRLVEELKLRNIGTSVHFIPLHSHRYYRETYGYLDEQFPMASREFLREVSLPLYSGMTDQDVQDVIDAVTDIVEHGS